MGRGRAGTGRLGGRGKIHYEEDVQHGLENAPATLRRLFEGRNLGKQLLQLSEPPIG